MKIENINLFKLNNNYTQHKNTKQINKSNQTYPQINDITKHFYIPFCGEKKDTNNIQKLLKDKTFKQEKKDYLSFLTTIDGFEDACKGMKANELKHFINVCLYFSPLTEEILKGNYTCVLNNIEKPLFDLKSVAKYNNKYPQNPQNLNDMLFTDNSLIKIFLSTLNAKKTKELTHPLELSYFADENQTLKLKTIIKYSPQKNVSLKEIKKYADMPINENAKTLFSFASLPADMKLTLWELTEIPYFNALSKNLNLEQLELITELTKDNKAFVMETFKGNVLQIDKQTGKENPIIDLEKMMRDNLTSNFLKQQNIFLEFFNNNLFKSCYETTFLCKNTQKEYPKYLFSMNGLQNNLISSFLNFTKEELISSYTNPKEDINNLILFKNDLNSITKLPNVDEIKLEKQEEVFENKEKSATPASVMEYLKSKNNDNYSKKIVYDFSEKIPYFNEIMQNSTEKDIELLVTLQKKNPKLFEKLINGKVKLENQKLIDTKELAINNKELTSILYNGALSVFLFEEISSLEKTFGKKIQKITTKINVENIAMYNIEFFKEENQSVSGYTIYLKKLPKIIEDILTEKELSKITFSIEE